MLLYISQAALIDHIKFKLEPGRAISVSMEPTNVQAEGICNIIKKPSPYILLFKMILYVSQAALIDRVRFKLQPGRAISISMELINVRVKGICNKIKKPSQM